MFINATEIMRRDESSYCVRFMTQHSVNQPDTVSARNVATDDPAQPSTDSLETANASDLPTQNSAMDSGLLEIEGQGVLMYEHGTSIPSHSMWILRPYVPPAPLSVDLPIDLTNSLGSGVNMMVSFLETLSESVMEDSDCVPSPLLELCRICEQHVPTWWFERHSDLCYVEHRIQSNIDSMHENLVDQRKTISGLLSSMEAFSRSSQESPTPGSPASSSSSSASSIQSSKLQTYGALSKLEYRGLSLPTPEPNPHSRTSSPSRSPRTHTQIGSITRPLSRSFTSNRHFPIKLMELLLELCDLALEIKSPERPAHKDATFFQLHSSETENKINQISNWTMPQLENEGLILLFQDTFKYAKQKMASILRMGDSIVYFQTVTNECEHMILNVIEDTVNKANQQRVSDLINNNTVATRSDTVEADAVCSPMIFADSYLKSDTLPVALPLTTEGPSYQPSAQNPASVTLTLGSFFSDESAPTNSTQVDPSQDIPAENDQEPENVQNAFKLHLPELDLNNSLNEGTSRVKRSISHVSASSHSDSRSRASIQRNKVTPTSEFPSSYTPISSPLVSAIDIPMEGSHRRQYSFASDSSRGALSPLITSSGPAKTAPPSIKDYEIINAISKGAFGSVYLARKKNTGEYFAIKVLKKADMIAKNQVMNVRAERAIMMAQSESPFVAKLYFTFQSKNYLFLVMEYLNGGDCAALVKVLGGLPEGWARKYIAEVIAGVEDLHNKGVVHRDLKPDNLLINNEGHLKLTDFGLSRMGLVGRQSKQSNKESSLRLETEKVFPFTQASKNSNEAPITKTSALESPKFSQCLTDPSANQVPDYFTLSSKQFERPQLKRSGSNESAAGEAMFNNAMFFDSPRWAARDDESSAASSELSSPQTVGEDSDQSSGKATPDAPTADPALSTALFCPGDRSKRFVGTPDYLSPETIRGAGQDEMSDWWSVGCILFEFVYGYPPFHAESPDMVFKNILANNIQWPENTDGATGDSNIESSNSAKDLIMRLLDHNPLTRLGASGTEEIKDHDFLKGVSWETLWDEEASFIPVCEDPESTDYFDARGADASAFPDDENDQGPGAQEEQTDTDEGLEDSDPSTRNTPTESSSISTKKPSRKVPLHIPLHVRSRNRRQSEPNNPDDFGNFEFRNLPMLDKANKTTLNRIVSENMERRNSFSSETNKRPRGLSISTGPSFKRPESPSFTPKHASPVTSMTHSMSSTNSPSSPLPNSFLLTGSPTSASSVNSSSNLSTPTTTIRRLSSFRPISANKSSVFPLSKDSKTLTEGNASSSPLNSPIIGASQLVGSPTKSPSASSMKFGSALSPRGLGLHRFAAMDSSIQKYSPVFDTSPSTSDTEDLSPSVFSHLNKRRELSFNSSNIHSPTPKYRKLIVLICESNPALLYSMGQIVKGYGCRYVSVSNTADAIRYATGNTKFDIILTEFNFPKTTGADVARIIHTTSNPNSETPIVCVTSYAPDTASASRSNFSSIIYKPPTREKLGSAFEKFCTWQPKGKHKLRSPSPWKTSKK